VLPAGKCPLVPRRCRERTPAVDGLYKSTQRATRRWSYTATTLCCSSSQPPACPGGQSSFDADYSAERSSRGASRTDSEARLHTAQNHTPRDPLPRRQPGMGRCARRGMGAWRSKTRSSAVCRPAPAALSDAHSRHVLAHGQVDTANTVDSSGGCARGVRKYRILGRECGARKRLAGRRSSSGVQLQRTRALYAVGLCQTKRMGCS
jgi:hypothetical protein